MNKTKSIKRGSKRIFAWIDSFTHAKLKAMAAMKHIYLEEFLTNIISEYLDRHEKEQE